MTARRRALVTALLLVLGNVACLKRGATDVPAAAAPAAPRAKQSHSEGAEAAPAAPSPRLLPDPASEPAPAAVDDLLTRVREILGRLAERTLSATQREERDAGVAFLAQAEEARDSGDPERAALLAEKARILIEDLERATRP